MSIQLRWYETKSFSLILIRTGSDSQCLEQTVHNSHMIIIHVDLHHFNILLVQGPILHNKAVYTNSKKQHISEGKQKRTTNKAI